MLKKIKGKKPIDLLRHYKRMAHDNIKDIIACGFNLEKTYIFQDGMAMGYVAILNGGAILTPQRCFLRQCHSRRQDHHPQPEQERVWL